MFSDVIICSADYTYPYRGNQMARLPLYYFNIVHGEDQAGGESPSPDALWAAISESVDSLQPIPKKMYNDGVFTFNNRLIVIPPENVSEALNEIYKMPDGQNKKVLLKLAHAGTSLVPCEEQQLLMAWHKSEAEILRKETAGVAISAEEIGKQSVFLLTRNKVIGQVIAQTLPEDEAGILFLGSVHNLEGMMVHYLRNVQRLNVIEMNPHIR
jgi:hypothetical protein